MRFVYLGLWPLLFNLGFLLFELFNIFYFEVNKFWKIFENFVHLDGWHVSEDQCSSMLIKVQAVDFQLVNQSPDQL